MVPVPPLSSFHRMRLRPPCVAAPRGLLGAGGWGLIPAPPSRSACRGAQHVLRGFGLHRRDERAAPLWVGPTGAGLPAEDVELWPVPIRSRAAGRAAPRQAGSAEALQTAEPPFRPGGCPQGPRGYSFFLLGNCFTNKRFKN